MPRATLQAVRSARHLSIRKLYGKAPLDGFNHGLTLRPTLSARRYSASSTQLQSMHGRNFSLAFLASLFASGAYYVYTGDGPKHLLNRTSVEQTNLPQTRGLSSTASSYSQTASPKTGAEAETAAADPGRRALVLDNEQFWMSSIAGSGPLSKDTDDHGRKVLEMMTPEQATERLRKSEESLLVGRGNGVVRYDFVQLPSNDPIEDDHAEQILEVPTSTAAAESGASHSDWMFWGVFDGHSGWTTSATLRQNLIMYAARELGTTYESALSNTNSPFPEPSAISAALKTAFVKLDNEICLESVEKLNKNPSKLMGAGLLAPALSGSCALLSFYDSRAKSLHVACTGDSRALLGRRNPQSGKWFATPLSEDQTGSNPNEEVRMRAEHPGEPYVIRHGRVLGGLEPTRAFGDAVYKWSKETQMKLKRHFFGKTPNQLLATPPYVTAEPVVTNTTIKPEAGDFVVLATDGLWEMLTNEEVVGLVGQWMEKEKGASNGSSWVTSWLKPAKALPVEKGGNSGKGGLADDSTEAPIRQQQWSIDGKNEGRFVVQDKNVATHLVRNALGGKDQDMVCALLTLPSPYSRRYR